MIGPDPRHTVWHRSSYSSANSNCVEVAFGDGDVAIRDSKAPETGHLRLPTVAFDAVRREVRAFG